MLCLRKYRTAFEWLTIGRGFSVVSRWAPCVCGRRLSPALGDALNHIRSNQISRRVLASCSRQPHNTRPLRWLGVGVVSMTHDFSVGDMARMCQRWRRWLMEMWVINRPTMWWLSGIFSTLSPHISLTAYFAVIKFIKFPQPGGAPSGLTGGRVDGW